MCRFCFSDEQTEDNPLVSPCSCIGSLKLIHYQCLRTWLARKEVVRVNADDQVISYSWKAFHCELCKAKYSDQIPNPMLKGKTVSIFEISKPEKDYIVLESFVIEATGQ